MNKRDVFRLGAGICAVNWLAAAAFTARSAAADYPIAAFNAEETDRVLTELFGTARADQDGSIDIIVPFEAETPDHVPFRVSAPGADRIALLLNNHPSPLILEAQLKHNPAGMVTAMFQLEFPAVISCYALKQGRLRVNSRFISIAGKGYEGA